MARQYRFDDLPDAAREGFEGACLRHGFVHDDFEVDWDDRPDKAGRNLTVTRITGGDLQHYALDGSDTWLRDFERDLQQGVFGVPLAD
ncbi:hypothetical protein SAMN05216345_105393 [Cupriavidus sp. YR651]|uniref:hypothetical protein n=1 Tax=Cupriavidus sp. YR651 TaxID=1855315 RepID=UPI0008862CAE|nr:hypothetical protein [Cupriavidus sp. YR651]SDD05569.1 hypothetical protein SAMN05216345_105393 [Cupriavidus sp. YR651]